MGEVNLIRGCRETTCSTHCSFSSLHTSRRNLLPIPIPTPPSPIHPCVLHHLEQPFCCPISVKQFLLFDAGPKVLAESCFHGARMQAQRDSILPRSRAKVIVERLDQLIHARFGRPIAVPSAQFVVADTTNTRRHDGHGCCGGQTMHLVVIRVYGRVFLGKKGREMLDHKHGAKCVGAEG